MATQHLLKIVYALDIKFWVRWCTTVGAIKSFRTVSYLQSTNTVLLTYHMRNKLPYLTVDDHFTAGLGGVNTRQNTCEVGKGTSRLCARNWDLVGNVKVGHN